MAILLNTSFIMEEPTEAKFKDVVHKELLPQLQKEEKIKDIKFLKILNSPHGDEAKSYALQFIVENDEDLPEIQATTMKGVFILLQQVFGQSVLSFSTEMALETQLNA